MKNKILQLGSKGQDVKKAQKKLADLGLYLGEIDGDYGPITEQSTRDFQKKYFINGQIDEITGNRLEIIHKKFIDKSESCPSLEDLNITKYHLNPYEYIQEITEKTNVTLHLTGGGPNGFWVNSTWANDRYRYGYSVATPFVICGEDNFQNPSFATKDGQILEMFPVQYWAHHVSLIPIQNKHNIGIEICNQAYLFENNGTFTTYTGQVIPENQVIEFEYRKLRYWQKITQAQLESTFKLIRALMKRYPRIAEGIKKQIFDDTWSNYNPDLVAGRVHGVFPHTAYTKPELKHRFDMPPFNEVIDMLSAL